MPQKRGFSNEQSTIGFHPLLEWAPEMAPFYAKPILVDLRAKGMMRCALQIVVRRYLITTWYRRFCLVGTIIILGRYLKQAYSAVTPNGSSAIFM